MEIDLVLAVAKNGVVHPTETRYLSFVVEELKFDRVGKLALKVWDFSCNSTIVLSFILNSLLMFAWYDNRLILNFFYISIVWLKDLKKGILSHKLVQVGLTYGQYKVNSFDSCHFDIKNGRVFRRLESHLEFFKILYRSVGRIHHDGTEKHRAIISTKNYLEHVWVWII